jgi:mannitol-specific phosphotransferase system IIBC component
MNPIISFFILFILVVFIIVGIYFNFKTHNDIQDKQQTPLNPLLTSAAFYSLLSAWLGILGLITLFVIIILYIFVAMEEENTLWPKLLLGLGIFLLLLSIVCGTLSSVSLIDISKAGQNVSNKSAIYSTLGYFIGVAMVVFIFILLLVLSKKNTNNDEMVKKESTQNAKEESTQNAKEESTQNAKEESTQNAKEESTQNAKQVFAKDVTQKQFKNVNTEQLMFPELIDKSQVKTLNVVDVVSPQSSKNTAQTTKSILKKPQTLSDLMKNMDIES